MGADHTAGYAIATNILKVGGIVDPLKTEGQVDLSRNLQIATAAIDSTGMCLFIAFPILDQPETFQALLELVNPSTASTRRRHGASASRSSPPSATSTPGPASRDRRPAAALLLHRADRAAQVTFNVTDEELDSVFNW